MASHELLLRLAGIEGGETAGLLFVDIGNEELPAGSRVEICPDELAAEC